MSRGEQFRQVPIGQRVTLLYRLPEGGMSEAVGPITERDEESLVIQTRRRGEVRVPYAGILTGRVVPDARPQGRDRRGTSGSGE